MKNLSSSQIYHFIHLFSFGTSHISAGLFSPPDQRPFGLIRHMFPFYNRSFDPNCETVFFIYVNRGFSFAHFSIYFAHFDSFICARFCILSLYCKLIKRTGFASSDLGSQLGCITVSLSLSHQVFYLIVLIPDLCTLTYFDIKFTRLGYEKAC